MHGICVYRRDKMQGTLEKSVHKWCMMENHIIIGQFRGNKAMVQKNNMLEQRITDQNQEVEEKWCFQVC